MCKKTIYIIILVSTLYSQSYFNRIFGSDIQYGDARSMALAGTYVTTGTSSSVISRNPARLSYISDGEKGYSIDFQINSRINSERRSIDILDSFGDFLAETDYVSNQSSNFYGSFGFIASDKNPKKGQVGGGASITTLASFDYMYEEEVRYEQSFDDGQSGSRDPLLGFNKYGSKGYIQLSSIGFGYSIYNEDEPAISIGISVNNLSESTVSDYIDIDTAFYSANTDYYVNFSKIKEHNATYELPSASYTAYSIEIPFTIHNNTNAIVIAGEKEALLTSKDYSSYILSNLSSLPAYLGYICPDANGEFTNLGCEEDLNDPSYVPDLTQGRFEYLLRGIEYYKPKKYTFGLRLQKHRTLIVLETVEEFYSDYDIRLNDVSEYKIAFEHKFKIGSDIRMGLSYKEPLINSLFSPISKFTLGSNRQINKKLNIDFAISYYTTNYKYDDIFPTAWESYTSYTDCSEFCEKITESNISISTTFKWDF